MKPFLILQLRELDGPADNEYEAFLKYGKLKPSEVRRIRMEKESFAGLDVSDYAGVMVGGGPSNVSDAESEKPHFQQRFETELNALYEQIFHKDIPYLGSCYGLGSIARFKGAPVSKERYSEPVGSARIEITEDGQQDPLLQGFPAQFTAFNGHKEACQTLPEGGVLLASSEACPVHMIRFGKNIYATQFHCELDAEGIAVRIKYYMNHGYFAPELADSLIQQTQDIIVQEPLLILQRFVERYRDA